MEIDRVADHLDTELNDVLATLPLVSGNARLTDRLFEQLVDLLLEGLVVGLRSELESGVITVAEYGNELAELAAQCRRVGLLARV